VITVNLSRLVPGAAFGAAVFFLAACSKTEGREQNGGPGGREGGAASKTGGAEGRAGGGGEGGRRGPMSISLAASDVRPVQKGTIEVGAAISGDLRPIEEVSVRARLEGDLVGVFVREGDRVRAGQLLARFEATEQESNRKSAEAERVAAQSDLATAQWNAEQSEELFKAGAIPERDVRAARQAVESARARLAAAESRVSSTSSFVNDTRVLAPTSGVIEQRLVENGEHVARGAEMFRLVRSDVLELAASVPARNANEIRPGQKVRFSAASRAFEGQVARVSPTINPSTRSITVYVQAPNSDGSLKGNTFATGRIVARMVSNAIVVPTLAIRQTAEDGRPFVYRIVNGTIEIALVQVGAVDEAQGLAEVTDGLQVGDQVIVGNVGTLGRGMRVQVLSGARDQPPAERGAPNDSARGKSRPPA
jgi:membrane fusion protein, multidrug efflux system